MKLAAPPALLLVAGLLACGSASVSDRAAIASAIRARAASARATHVQIEGIRISKLDPDYAFARESYTRRNGQGWAVMWILRRTGSAWRATSATNMFPVCGAAPPKVLKELMGTAGCYPAVGVYTSIYWAHGHTARLRYCERPGGPGNFLAASKGVTCRAAAAVIHTVTHRCSAQASCVAGGFDCRNLGAHATCIDGDRRIAWDGG